MTEKLLAPNGKPSNLNPEQYKLVRTPAFKEWFGDWENDPENSSKVVDENGEPLVVYHGTNSEFNIFKLDYSSTNTGSHGFLGSGFYFATNKKDAEYYGNKVEPYFIKSVKNLDLRYLDYKELAFLLPNLTLKSGKKWKDAFIEKEEAKKKIGQIQKEDLKNGFYNIHYQYNGEWFMIPRRSINEISSNLIEELILDRIIDKDTENIGAIGNYFNPQMLSEEIKNQGYDSVFSKGTNIFDKGDELVVFEPTQIKLADGSNTTFDGNNPDIRFMAGGNVEDLISKGIVELKMFDTKSEHAKEYGFDVKKPLYVQSICITESKRLKGIGKKVLDYIDEYAVKNGHDLVFGHITQKANFTKDSRHTDLCDIDLIKEFLIKGGYNTIKGNNDFYKLIKTNPDIRFDGGGSVLLAPNGKPSNLTPEQYKLVRTKAFKDWFGDWENDPANASKVVDENGEPLVVYHYTDKKFDIFRLKGLSDGFFFTEYKKDSEFSTRGLKSKQYFLNIKKIAELSEMSYEKWSVPKYENEWIKKSKEHGADGIQFIRENISFYPKKWQQNKRIIVAYEPNQIKLADGTNTTFDGNNDDIRYAGGGELGVENFKKMNYNELMLYIKDSYKELGAEIGVKGHTEDGEPIIGYLPYQNEYMYKSDSTGKNIRFYIDLGNEKYIHPSEINPKFNVSEQKRIEQKADYFAKISNEEYNKIISELEKNNELNLVVDTLNKALKTFNIENQYDSSDIFKSYGNSILESKDGNKRRMKFDVYYFRVNDSELKTNVKNLDLERFNNEYLKKDKFKKGGEIKEFVIGATYSGKYVQDIVSNYDSQEGTDMKEFASDPDKINPRDKYILEYVNIKYLLENDINLRTFISEEYNPEIKVDYQEITEPILLGYDQWDNTPNVVLDGFHRVLQALYNGQEEIIAFVNYKTADKITHFSKGGRTIAQTPAPKKERIYGSEKNKPESSKDTKSAEKIEFNEKTLETIKNKVAEHNENNPNKKVTLASAKAVVRRGMGAYSSSHRPTISGGKPNSRVAWGLARLNAFLYKIINGKSKSGKYNQDDDLINELGYKVKKYIMGGELNEESQMYIDIISNNPNASYVDKYKKLLMDKYSIDFDEIYKQQDLYYLSNIDLNNIKKKDDFLSFDNYLEYAKKISEKRGFIKMDSYITPYDINPSEILERLSNELGFEIEKKEYSDGQGGIAHAFGGKIYYTDYVDMYYILHELGHVYDFITQYEGIAKNPSYAPTNYGTSNVGEVFAENFAVYFINPQALKDWNQEVFYELESKIKNNWKDALNRELSKARGFNYGGELLSNVKSKLIDILSKNQRYSKVKDVQKEGDEIIKKSSYSNSYTAKSIEKLQENFILIAVNYDNQSYESKESADFLYFPKPNSNTEIKVGYRYDLKEYPMPIMFDKSVIENTEYTPLNDYEEINSSDFDEHYLYRGISYDEMLSIVESGSIKSNALMNIGSEQSDTTSFAQHISQASNYAVGLNAWYDEISFQKPKYVIKVKKEGVNYKPTIETDPRNEVDVYGVISSDKITDVYEIRLGSCEQGGSIEIKLDYDDNPKEGSRSPLSKKVFVRKIPFTEFKKQFVSDTKFTKGGDVLRTEYQFRDVGGVALYYKRENGGKWSFITKEEFDQNAKSNNIIIFNSKMEKNPKDTITMDIPLFIRMLELAREDIKSDAELHQVVEKVIDLKDKELNMDDYDYIVENMPSQVQEYAKGGSISNILKRPLARLYFYIYNDSYGNMELGTHRIELKGIKGESIIDGAFIELGDCLREFISFCYSDWMKYITKNENNSKFEIRSVFYDGVSEDYDGYPLKKEKTILNINAKTLSEYIELERFKKGGQTDAQQQKVQNVMHEFKQGKLKTSYGEIVTNPKQAIAIALSEAGVEKKEDGGYAYDDNRKIKSIKAKDQHIPINLEEYWFDDDSGVELVPVSELIKFREFNRHITPKWNEDESKRNINYLKNAFIKDGIKEPLIIEYNHEDRMVLLVEGNHRLNSAIEMGLEFLPARVRLNKYGTYKGDKKKSAMSVKGVEPNEFGYIPSDLKPSQVGIAGSVAMKFEEGGIIEGQLHSECNEPHGCGEKFQVGEGGSIIEAERDEAVIVSNTFKDSDEYTIEGTPSEIASALNVLGGGKNFNKGATIEKDGKEVNLPEMKNEAQDTNVEPIIEGGSIIINRRSMADDTNYEVTGTPRQIASAINSVDGNGVVIEKGADLKKI